MPRSFDPVQLGSIELFCRAAELQGFTAAAQALGVTAAAVSRSVGRLEARLGVRLFTRTTRVIRLTEAGQAYFIECRQALSQITEAERAVTGLQAAPTGFSAIIDPAGNVEQRSGIGEAHVLRQRVELRDGRTLAMIWGEAPALVLSALALVAAWLLERRRRDPAGSEPVAQTT